MKRRYIEGVFYSTRTKIITNTDVFSVAEVLTIDRNTSNITAIYNKLKDRFHARIPYYNLVSLLKKYYSFESNGQLIPLYSASTQPFMDFFVEKCDYFYNLIAFESCVFFESELVDYTEELMKFNRILKRLNPEFQYSELGFNLSFTLFFNYFTTKSDVSAKNYWTESFYLEYCSFVDNFLTASNFKEIFSFTIAQNRNIEICRLFPENISSMFANIGVYTIDELLRSLDDSAMDILKFSLDYSYEVLDKLSLYPLQYHIKKIFGDFVETRFKEFELKIFLAITSPLPMEDITSEFGRKESRILALDRKYSNKIKRYFNTFDGYIFITFLNAYFDNPRSVALEDLLSISEEYGKLLHFVLHSYRQKQNLYHYPYYDKKDTIDLQTIKSKLYYNISSSNMIK